MRTVYVIDHGDIRAALTGHIADPDLRERLNASLDEGRHACDIRKAWGRLFFNETSYGDRCPERGCIIGTRKAD